MTFSIESISLFAVTHMAEISGEYRERADTTSVLSVSSIMVIAGIIAAASIAWYLYRKSHHKPHCPNALLKELCRVHGIDRTGAKLLRTIACEASVEQPATLFLAVSSFDAAFHQTRKKVKFTSDQIALITMIRRRMFA